MSFCNSDGDMRLVVKLLSDKIRPSDICVHLLSLTTWAGSCLAPFPLAPPALRVIFLRCLVELSTVHHPDDLPDGPPICALVVDAPPQRHTKVQAIVQT